MAPMGRAKEAAVEALTAVEGTAVAFSDAAASAGRAELSAAKASLSRRTRLPGPARFALVVILSFALSALGYSFLGYWTENELANIARPARSRTEVTALAAWRLYVSAECSAPSRPSARLFLHLTAEEG